jgi:2,3-diketo-5-methylthio-1-phosphopentane phosphatase
MVRVFCDFDGTVSPEDVGATFFRTFAGEKACSFSEDALPDGVPMQKRMEQLCAALPPISVREFETFVDQFAVDPHFPDFVRFCEERNMPVMILSDGLDLYVRRILRRAALERVPFFANRAEFVPASGGTKLALSFPYSDAECTCCGNCKRNHMFTASADDDVLVYVGDGYSDRCPVRFADVVFAKRHLIKYCQAQNVSYFEFTHFGDVQERLQEILQRKRIRRRQEAAMARRDVYMQG